jgi:hypothetical protein
MEFFGADGYLSPAPKCPPTGYSGGVTWLPFASGIGGRELTSSVRSVRSPLSPSLCQFSNGRAPSLAATQSRDWLERKRWKVDLCCINSYTHTHTHTHTIWIRVALSLSLSLSRSRSPPSNNKTEQRNKPFHRVNTRAIWWENQITMTSPFLMRWGIMCHRAHGESIDDNTILFCIFHYSLRPFANLPPNRVPRFSLGIFFVLVMVLGTTHNHLFASGIAR